MGRKWNNIKYGKAAKDAARSKVFSSFGKEIYMAAKNGDPDPALNRNLASVIDRAKVAGVNREIIDRAINKAKGVLKKTMTSFVMKDMDQMEQQLSLIH